MMLEMKNRFTANDMFFSLLIWTAHLFFLLLLHAFWQSDLQDLAIYSDSERVSWHSGIFSFLLFLLTILLLLLPHYMHCEGVLW